MVSTQALTRIAAVGAIIVTSTGVYLRTKITDRVRGYDYYKNALTALREHPGALKLLGEPIYDRTFTLSDSENNFCDGYTARFKVPVGGKRQKGTYYFWSERINNEWVLIRSELELNDNANRRLVIKKQIENTLADDSNTSGNIDSKIIQEKASPAVVRVET